MNTNNEQTSAVEKKVKTKWPIDRIKETALKYKTKGEWSKSNDQSAYQAARKLGNEFLESVCAHMDKPQRGRKKKETQSETTQTQPTEVLVNSL